MTHLNIQQGSNVEIVSAQIIKKLYDTALTVSEPLEGETDAAYMSGHISVPYTYESYVNYLAGTIREGTNGIVSTQRSNPSGRFQNLTVDVTNGYYIPFEDPNMVTYLNSIGVGSNGSITTNEAAAATIVANSENTEITKFNELKYFTSITGSKGGWTGNSTGSVRFYNWTALEEVDISNFTSIGHYNGIAYEDTFYNCTSLKKVTASDKLKKIGYSAFNGCSNLEDIVDENGNPALSGIITLSRYAFQNCAKLKNSNFTNCSFLFDFTDSNAIGSYFNGCTLLTSIALATTNDPENPGQQIGLNTNVPKFSFNGCTNLTTVTGLDKVTQFGESAFQNCKNLVATIDLTDVTSLGSKCFYNAYNLTFIGDTSKITTWGQQNFYCTSNDHRIDLSNVTITLNNNANAGNKSATFQMCILPSTIILGENVTEIPSNFCYTTTGIQTITQTISDPNKTGVTTIREKAFHSSTIQSVPSTNVQTIEHEAFRGCTNLTTINFPNLTSLSGSNTFYGCTNLTTVTSLGSITSIPTNIFRDCTSLSSINIPSTVTSYGESSFRDCTSLYATIDLTGVTNIGVEPFVGSHVSFTGNTSSITTLGSGAFKNSSISGNLSFPSLTSMGSQVFNGCSNIQSIDFTGSTITSIPTNTFRDCTSLSKITIPTTVTYLGEYWQYGTSKTLTLEGFDNVSSHNTYNYTIDNKTITNPVKVSYSDDDSVLFRLNGNDNNTSINQLYEPLRTSTKNGFRNSNNTYNTMYTYNVSSGSGMISFELLYYRDITSFGNRTFYRCIIDNLVINNVTPPTFTPNADESSSIWIDKIFPTGNSTASENVVIGTLWVPDSAVATYQANPLYSHLNIKGINTKTNGVDYDLPRYANYAAWKTAEEAAVAQNSHTPVGLIEAWM